MPKNMRAIKIRGGLTWKAGFLRYVGAKNRLSRYLLPLFPSHKTYVEAFGGSAALLLRKEPSPVEVYNDIDGDLVNLFRVVRTPDLFRELLDRSRWTLYSRQEYETAIKMLADPNSINTVDRAWAFFTATSQCRNGILTYKQWRKEYDSKKGKLNPITNEYINRVRQLPYIRARLQQVIIENCDYKEILNRYDSPETLFYLDPPYVHQTRTSGDLYRHEMDICEHARLVDRILGLQGKVILSGYSHPVYTPLEQAGWQRLEFEVQDRFVNQRDINRKQNGYQKRIECVWLNPAAQVK